MPDNYQTRVLQPLMNGFKRIGYTDQLVQQDYVYADILAHVGEYKTKTIPLAVFSQTPFSYKTASFGVIISNGRSGHESVQECRSLGAPQIIEVTTNEVTRWKVSLHDDPVCLGIDNLDDLHEIFDSNREEWAPGRVFTAKSDTSRQLDFIDLGLLPALDHEVRKKITNLLEDSIDLAKRTVGHGRGFSDDDYPSLFRLVFRLISAKILMDRKHPALGPVCDSQSAVREAENFCFGDRDPESVLMDSETQTKVWNHIQNAFHFQNLSVNALAYVYENTLVTDKTRRDLGIHSTPPEIAEYIVRNLPIEKLEPEERRVFEPFSGHSVFLVAAMQRLKDLLPDDMASEERHRYLVRMLNGIEIDSFAREVALLSLMMSDYPNSNGWNLHDGDAFTSTQFESELNNANIVLCNPPFEEFSKHDKLLYGGISSNWKAAEALNRVLQSPPKLLGFVMPRAFISSDHYRGLQEKLGRTYSSIEVIALPDNVFRTSGVETVLLLCSGEYRGAVSLRTIRVSKKELQGFYAGRTPSSMDESTVAVGNEFANVLWIPPIKEVWEATAGMSELREFITIRTGIRYVDLAKNRTRVISTHEKPGFKLGIDKVHDSMEPYVAVPTGYLNMDSDLMTTSTDHFLWDEPKLIINSIRRSRGIWKTTSAIDHRGLVLTRNLYGIWPAGKLKLEVIAAILNGPVGNGFLHSQEKGRHIRITDLRKVPVPEFTVGQQEAIVSLVQQYVHFRELWRTREQVSTELYEQCLMLLKAIDAEVLKAYHLEPRLERMLLDSFGGQKRPGPVKFREYYPSDFKPYIPWHIYISEEFEKSKAKYILERPVIPACPVEDEFLSYLE